MAIKFLTDHQVGTEAFTAGQVVEGRSPESEMHFVRRRKAAFIRDGGLFDHEGKEVVETATTEIVTAADNRDGEVGRAGETLQPDGAPQKAASGPGSVMTSAASAAKPKSRAKAKSAAKRA